MKTQKPHENSVNQNYDLVKKTARVQDDSRGGPTKLVRERSNTMSHGSERKARPDGKRNF